MDEEKLGGGPPSVGVPPEAPHSPAGAPPAEPPVETEVHYEQGTDDSYGYADDPYAYHPSTIDTPEEATPEPNPVAVVPAGVPVKPPPPAPPAPPDDEDEDDEGMLRMSFLEHLEELRTRIIRMLMGLGLAFLFALIFAGKLWDIISEQPSDVASTRYQAYLTAGVERWREYRESGRHRSAGLDQAAVSVYFAQARARHVLSVPVTALLAVGGGNYAVQDAAAPHTLIPVTVGLFAAGYVQVSGAGIHSGLQVTDSQG